LEVHDILAGIAVLIGLAGVVLVFIPGVTLQVGAVLLWALEESNPTGWVVLSLVVALAVAASVLKFTFPGRRLKAEGLPRWVLLAAVAGGIVGFFAIPVVGAPLGFVLGIYLFERVRRGREQAWPSTRSAVRAVLTSMGIELAGGFLILLVFAAGALLT